MNASPKRKSQSDNGNDVIHDESTKKLRLNDSSSTSEMAVDAAPPDSRIDHIKAIAYWSSTSPTDAGVLGGYPQVSRVDLQGSKNFLAKIRRRSKHFSQQAKFGRVVDCGAGIGRVTKGFLSDIATTVDVVEPVKAFTDRVKNDLCVGQIYNIGLEKWYPEQSYDVIWNQWCVGQLTDVQLREYLLRLPPALSEGGWIVVKENISSDVSGEDIYDETDNSVTRTDAKFRKLFDEAGLVVVATELQRGLPKELYAVRSYALQAK